MCWENEAESYNDGGAFKLTCRTTAGVIVTLIADNYFGYCKKEVKTQISYAANLYGNVEEEHAGGALVFPSYNLGEEFHADSALRQRPHASTTWCATIRSSMDVEAGGLRASTRNFPDLIYIAGDAQADLHDQQALRGTQDGDGALASRCCPARST